MINQNILNFGEFTKYDEEREHLHPFKRHIYRSEKAKNMQVIAERLVLYYPYLQYLHAIFTLVYRSLTVVSVIFRFLLQSLYSSLVIHKIMF